MKTLKYLKKGIEEDTRKREKNSQCSLVLRINTVKWLYFQKHYTDYNLHQNTHAILIEIEKKC